MILLSTIPAAVLATILALSSLGGAGDATPRAPRHVGPAHTASASTSRDSTPLYTEEQATAGAELFGRVCVECHEKTDVTKADFRAKWTSRPIFDLYELIRTTMPESNPGVLSRDEYAGALAYILKMNGLPSGTSPVMPDSAAMQGAKLEFPPAAPPQAP